MAKKERRDYTIAGLPFYQTELVMGQVELQHELETEARKAGYLPDDPTDEEKFGAYVVKYGVALLAIGLIPADQDQGDRFEDEDKSRAAVQELKRWLRRNIDPTDVPQLVADFFVFSLRSKNKALRALSLQPVELDAPNQTQATGSQMPSSS